MATKGPYEIRKNLELASGDILYREAGVYDTTLGLIDFGDTSLGGGKTEGILRMTKSETCATWTIMHIRIWLCSMMAAFVLTSITGQNHAAESFIIPATCTKQLVRMWFKLRRRTSEIQPFYTITNCWLLAGHMHQTSL